MKTTNANVTIAEPSEHKNGDAFFPIFLAFELSADDLAVVEDIIKPALDDTTQNDHDLADVLLTCLTYGIHRAYQDATGKKWTLRMDRKKPKS